MSARTHLFETITNTSGAPIAGANVYVYQTGTTTPITETIYATRTGATTLTNPLTANSQGEVEFWLAIPKRVDLYITASGVAETQVLTVDLLPSGDEVIPEITVDSFGAVGDAVTNDTVAIKAAIASAGAGPAIIGFTPGKTYLADNFFVDDGNYGGPMQTGLILWGYGATIKQRTKDIAQLDVFGDNAVVAGLTFDGNKAAFTTPNSSDNKHIGAYGSGAKLVDLWMKNSAGNCISGSTAKHWLISNCHFREWTRHLVYISTANSYDVRLTHFDAVATGAQDSVGSFNCRSGAHGLYVSDGYVETQQAFCNANSDTGESRSYDISFDHINGSIKYGLLGAGTYDDGNGVEVAFTKCKIANVNANGYLCIDSTAHSSNHAAGINKLVVDDCDLDGFTNFALVTLGTAGTILPDSVRIVNSRWNGEAVGTQQVVWSCIARVLTIDGNELIINQAASNPILDEPDGNLVSIRGNSVYALVASSAQFINGSANWAEKGPIHIEGNRCRGFTAGTPRWLTANSSSGNPKQRIYDLDNYTDHSAASQVHADYVAVLRKSNGGLSAAFPDLVRSAFKVATNAGDLGSIVLADAALATTATDGFVYLPSCAGAPTGVPTTQTGAIPLVVDSTNGKLYAYVGGAWKQVTFA